MKKRSVTIRAAWISALAVIASALITGVFLLLDEPAPGTAETSEIPLQSLLLQLPPGSKVTILVEGAGTEAGGALQAKFEKVIAGQATLELVEPALVEGIVQSLGPLDESALAQSASQLNTVVDYILLARPSAGSVALLRVATGEMLAAAALP